LRAIAFEGLVSQTVVRGGPQAVSEEKALQIMYQALNE
jgi:hypothetical protein